MQGPGQLRPYRQSSARLGQRRCKNTHKLHSSVLLILAQFFVSLWDELQARAAKRSSGASFTGNMSYDDVKGRTSSSVGIEEDGGLFDETISAYSMRRKVAHDLLVRAFDAAHSKALR